MKFNFGLPKLGRTDSLQGRLLEDALGDTLNLLSDPKDPAFNLADYLFFKCFLINEINLNWP